MRIFKSKAEKQREAIDILRNCVLDCTFTVSEKIINAVESEQIMLSDECNYQIKQEVLYFYLLYIDRVAMNDNNMSFYEKLQDAMVVSTCEVFVDMQFNINKANGDFDVEKWRTGMVQENVDLYNERGENFSALPLVSKEDLLSDESILIKTVENIDGSLGREQNIDLRLISEMPFWLIQTANDNQLVEKVNDIRKVLK